MVDHWPWFHVQLLRLSSTLWYENIIKKVNLQIGNLDNLSAFIIYNIKLNLIIVETDRKMNDDYTSYLLLICKVQVLFKYGTFPVELDYSL